LGRRVIGRLLAQVAQILCYRFNGKDDDAEWRWATWLLCGLFNAILHFVAALAG
jgi:hypothetical protein